MTNEMGIQRSELEKGGGAGLIEVKFATKYYKEHVGLEKVYMTARPGDVVGILGENGAGKTTLLKAVAGLLALDTGEVWIDRKQVLPGTYPGLSYITEEGSFFPFLTPLEHEEFFAAHFPKFDAVRYHKLMDFFGINKKKRLSGFSKGEQLKFEVVCGFSKGAKYILMDEPFLGKDIFTRRDFLKLMISEMGEDEILLIATHFIEEIENFLNQAVILKHGRVLETLDMEALREQGQSLFERMKKIAGYRENRVLDVFE